MSVQTHPHTHTHTYTPTHIIDMATPALSRFGSDELKRQFLAPSIAGDILACLGVSEVGSGSDVASVKTTARPKKGNPLITSPFIFFSHPHHLSFT